MKYGASLMLILTTAMWSNAADNSPEKHIRESAAVLNEIMNAKDNGIPEDLLQKAQCVGVIPNLKRAGFIVGAKYGKGIVTCRVDGGWSAPEIARIEGGSVGLQIGAGETDVVFIVMNERGMNKLMKDKFTLGGDASVMAGPVGRSAEAQTDASMTTFWLIRDPVAYLQVSHWKALLCGRITMTIERCMGLTLRRRISCMAG